MKEELETWKRKQLEIERLQSEQKIVSDKIEKFVLENKATLEGDGVKAVFSKGRGSYNYKEAGKNAPDELLDKHKIIRIDWRKVCKDAGIEGDELKNFYKEGKPSVSIKLI